MNSVSRKRKANRFPKKGKPVKIPRQNGMMMVERMEHPPEIAAYELSQSRRLRFTATAATAATFITYQNILDLMLVAVSAVQGYDVFDIVRVKQVEVWSQAALGTPSTVTVIFVTPNFGDQSIHTDTSLGVKPAYVKAVPNESSLASFYQVTGAGNCFRLTCPAGSVIDVVLDLKTTNVVAQVAANALVGATLGEFYFRGLDGLAIAGTNFPPIAGVATI